MASFAREPAMRQSQRQEPTAQSEIEESSKSPSLRLPSHNERSVLPTGFQRHRREVAENSGSGTYYGAPTVGGPTVIVGGSDVGESESDPFLVARRMPTAAPAPAPMRIHFSMPDFFFCVLGVEPGAWLTAGADVVVVCP